MNKQEAIEKINNITARETFMSEIILVKRDEVLDIIKQLDEPQKPQKVTVPKFVAEWIEESKRIHNNLSWVWFSNPVSDELNAWLKNHTETFMRAWLDGYTIEQERLFNMEVLND